jgi:hypothetical protein
MWQKFVGTVMIELKDTWLTLILKRLSKNSVEDAVIFLGFTGYSHDSLLEINCGDTVSIEFWYTNDTRSDLYIWRFCRIFFFLLVSRWFCWRVVCSLVEGFLEWINQYWKECPWSSAGNCFTLFSSLFSIFLPALHISYKGGFCFLWL